VSELESNIGALSRDEEPEEAMFNATDYVEAEAANNVDNAAEDAETAENPETEERASDEHSDLHDARLCEPTGEVVDGARDTDVVDAPSPMDVDAAQPTDTEITASDAGCDDGAMQVEYDTGAEDTGGSTSYPLIADSGSNEIDRESPMAEDKDDTGEQSCHATAEEVNNLEDSENIISQADASDAAEYDEVDASQSKISHQNEVTDNSQDLDKSRNSDGLVEGADFTVELQQPDTSEQDSATSDTDQPVARSEAAEKTGTESEMRVTDESDKTLDDVKTTASDASAAPALISSDSVCI